MKKTVFILIFILPQFLRSQQIIEKEITDWEFRMVGDSVWKPAKVPGTIIDNFVDLSDISNPLHPYYGDNEKLYQWIGEKDWEFRTTIDIDVNLLNQGYTYSLYFGCLDVFADVYLDDFKFESNNAFIPLEFTDLADPHIDILIKFHSTVDSVKKMMQNDSLNYPGGERVYARTAQYQFGWDWGPKFVNMGIRKPVVLTITSPKYGEDIPHYVSIDGLRFEPWKMNTKKKGLSVFLDGKTNCDSLDWHFKLYLNGDSIGGFDGKWHTYLDGAYLYFLEDVQEWWPNSSGKESNYYEFDIRFTIPGDTNTLAHKHYYYALCDIQLEQKKDNNGQSFTFKVNGKNIYAKGANYVPDDSFQQGKNTIDLVKLAHDANMNMLRVWGGGTYPDDDFYIECMKNGIIVWQDYMYACAMYPVNDDFLYNAQQEAYVQIDRLYQYNHIAVWCGNNENEEGWKNWGWQEELNISSSDSTIIWEGYSELFEYDLKNLIDTTRVNYISTSPKHGWGRKESMTEGDSHYWGVWWGLEPLEKYNEKVPRFMSEFGMQGMPDLSTLQKVIPDSAMNFDSPKFKNHQKHPTGFKTLDHYLKEYFVIPNNIEDYAYATQILQAYALSIAIEAQRRAMPYCMGSLIWQLNDCWPVTSWSIIDSELNKKIAYTEVSRAFESLTISINETELSYDIYVINEEEEGFRAEIAPTICDFYGNVIWSKRYKAKIKSGTSQNYISIPKTEFTGIDLSSVYMLTWVYNAPIGKKVILNNYATDYYHFVRPNQLKLPKPNFEFSMSENGYIQIINKVYCPYVLIPGDKEHEEIYVSELAPGTYPCSFLPKSDDEQLKYLKMITPKIKCLNTLLNN